MEAIDVEANDDARFVVPTGVFSSRADLSDPFGRTRDESGQPFAASDKTASRANSSVYNRTIELYTDNPLSDSFLVLYTEYCVYEVAYVVMPYLE